MRHSLCLIALLFCAAANADDGQSAPLPAWLAGHWCSQNADELGEEYWLAPAGQLMLGLNRTLGGGSAQFEFLRIEVADGVATYIAQPKGAAGTRFTRSAGGETWVRFSNLKHDFPQHIEYRRDGDHLRASIEGPGEDGKTMSIAFAYIRCPG